MIKKEKGYSGTFGDLTLISFHKNTIESISSIIIYDGTFIFNSLYEKFIENGGIFLCIT